MLEFRKYITRKDLKSEPDTLFVFGDNLERRGLGGQAREMRGEPNAVGIPTKKRPDMRPDAFFTDDDLHDFLYAADNDIDRLRQHQESGGKIVWPADGIGTGLARLPQSAPAIWKAIEGLRCELVSHGQDRSPKNRISPRQRPSNSINRTPRKGGIGY